MGWHSDDEPELGPVPMIASLSLGGPRRFLLRHRQRKDLPVHEIMLGHGALLLMGAGSQAAWRHSVPRTAQAERSDHRYRAQLRFVIAVPTHAVGSCSVVIKQNTIKRASKKSRKTFTQLR